MTIEQDADLNSKNINLEVRQGRHLSWRLFKYFFIEFLLPLAGCLVGFLALFVICDVFNYLPDFLRKDSKSSIVEFFVFVYYRQANSLVHVLPMSVLLASSYMIANLSKNHEITALRSAGLSIAKCCSPVWLIAIVCSFSTFLMSEMISPRYNIKAKTIIEQLKLSKKEKQKTIVTHRQAFHNNKMKRDWLFEHFFTKGMQKGVFLQQRRSDNSVFWVLNAEKAERKNGTWVFYNGKIAFYNKEKIQEKSILFKSSMDNDFIKKLKLEETVEQIMSSLRPIDELSVFEILYIIKNKKGMSKRILNEYWTKVWYKFAFPFSCLLAALLGISLCLVEARSGALKGFALAIGIMIGFYGISQSFLLLGDYGFLPPIIAGCLPTLSFLTWGVISMYHKR